MQTIEWKQFVSRTGLFLRVVLFCETNRTSNTDVGEILHGQMRLDNAVCALVGPLAV